MRAVNVEMCRSIPASFRPSIGLRRRTKRTPRFAHSCWKIIAMSLRRATREVSRTSTYSQARAGSLSAAMSPLKRRPILDPSSLDVAQFEARP